MQRNFVDRQVGGSVKIFAIQMDKMLQDELNRKKKARECMRGAWPPDRKGNHQLVGCYGIVKTNTETVNVPKPKEYLKLQEVAYKLEEDQKDLIDRSLGIPHHNHNRHSWNYQERNLQESWQIGGHNK
jgi:hypothetical protein